MIPEIKEINWPPYATLSEATITRANMGENVITATVKIDGQIHPDFDRDWVVEYKGERYIHNSRKPQASKDNTDIRSSIELTFRHWVEIALKRYLFVEMTHVDANTIIPDKYEASVSLNLGDFVNILNNVLTYYFKDSTSDEPYIRCELFQGDDTNPAWEYAVEPTTIEISHSHIWDLLGQVYDLYGVWWQIVSDPKYPLKDHAIIQFGFPHKEIDHIFEYGFEKGLLKVERQAKDTDLQNILLGRGGEKNVPYRYFKNIDANNPEWAADPDWIPELKDIYFDRIRDAGFRSYIQGYKFVKYKNGILENSQIIDKDHTAIKWAWEKGYADAKEGRFDPIEFVGDRIVSSEAQERVEVDIYQSYTADIDPHSSIAKNGVFFGSLENNDEIYPTIQGVSIPPYGRIDEVVDVQEIEHDYLEGEFDSGAIMTDIPTCSGTHHLAIGGRTEIKIPIKFYDEFGKETSYLTVPQGMHAEITEFSSAKFSANWNTQRGAAIKNNRERYGTLWEQACAVLAEHTIVANTTGSANPYIEFTNVDTFATATIDVTEGRWEAAFKVTVDNTLPNNGGHDTHTGAPLFLWDAGGGVQLYLDGYAVTASISGVKLRMQRVQDDKREDVFDIWVKNIWNTKKGYDANGNEIRDELDQSDGLASANYARRVWSPILGDREKNEVKIVFASGLLSISSDYEFTIVGMPVYDTSKTMEDGTRSEWRITLGLSNAELETTGKYIPNTRINAKAGDFFYFIGIDMPYMYYTEAEKRLTLYKEDCLKDTANINPTWVVSLDKVRIGSKYGDETMPLIEVLDTGDTLRLFDKRFMPEPTDDKAYEVLYIQSLTKSYKEPTDGDPYIVPDIEIVLSDKYSSAANPVALMQGEINSLTKQVGAMSNVEQVVRAVGDKLYLRKDGISDLSFSPTQFDSLVTSKDFRIGGLGGVGWGIYRDGNGSAILEIDKAVIRQSLEVTELVLNQVSARGGMIIESAAAINCTLVQSSKEGYYCYFDSKQGSLGNLFVEGDIAFNQQWDYANNKIKYYKRKVVGVGDDYILLTKDAYDEKGTPTIDGEGIPMAGDTIIQYGNFTDKNRQYVIIRDTVNGGYERFLDGIDGVTALGVEYWYVGHIPAEGNRLFFGSRGNDQYIEFKDGKLRIPATVITQSTFNDGSTLEDYLDNIQDSIGKQIAGFDYLREALQQGSTAIQGGLVLTSLIQLGKNSVDGYTVWSGINGIPDQNKDGLGIAAWYGGTMVDRESKGVNEAIDRPARSLFRFDGSGYLASGAISWDINGDGGLGIDSQGKHIISWSHNPMKVTLSEDIKLGASEETLSTLLGMVYQFNEMFEIEVLRNGKRVIHAKLDGLYSNGEIAALGKGTMLEGGGSGSDSSVTSLGDLDNVSIGANLIALADQVLFREKGSTSWGTKDLTDIQGVKELGKLTDIDISNPVNGQTLVYNDGKWYNAFQQPSVADSLLERIAELEHRVAELEAKNNG